MKRRMVGEGAIDVMIKSLSKNSLKQYDSCIRQWWQYCKLNNQDLFCVSVPKLLSYLMSIFNKGASYQTLNCHRSALSLIIGNHIGNDDRMKRWFKGVFKIRPFAPKYTSTWDPNIVLTFLKQWHPLEDLDLEKLTKKTAMLLALTTGQRVQTLSVIRHKNIRFSESGVDIILSDILKTSTPGRWLSKICLPCLDETDICPVKSLCRYLDMTKQLRQEDGSYDYLFLTFKRPYRRATSQTISRWLKQVMKDSGIDVSIFSSHSTRHAASSKALRQGLTVDSILKAVGWSAKSMTFAKHYNRLLQNRVNAQLSFANAICNSS